MAINASKSKNAGASGVDFEPVNPGTYPARLVAVVDLGLQPQRPFQGQDKPPAYEVLTIYEFLDEFLPDEDGQPDESKPRWLSERFPLHSLVAERAKSTKRYHALDPNEVHKGDWARLLATPCLVTVVHNPGKNNKAYANISNVAAMRAKDADKAPSLVNDAVAFDLDAPDVEVFTKLPKWIQEKIKSNLEFTGSKLEQLLGDTESDNQHQSVKPSAKAASALPTDEDDEQPF